MSRSDVTLHWQGPRKVGNMPEDRQEIEKFGLDYPGVYLIFQRYPKVTVIYAGKSNNLAQRFREHLAGYLAFGYYLRIDDPKPDRVKNDESYAHMRPQDNGLGCYKNLDEMLKISTREVRRLSFYYCPFREKEDTNNIEDGYIEGAGGISIDDLTTWVEAFLINDLKIAEKEAEPIKDGGWACDNGPISRTDPDNNDKNIYINNPRHVFCDDTEKISVDLIALITELL